MERGWERRAEPPELAPEEIVLRVEPYAGARPVLDSTPLGGGLVNLNLRVRLGDPDEDIVLRVHLRSDEPAAAAKEAAVLRSLPPGVPAPRVLHAGIVAERPQAIHSFIQGSPLLLLLRGTRARDPAQPALARAGRHIGRALAALHAEPRANLGFLDGTLAVPDPMGALDEVWRGFLKTALFAGRAGGRLPPEERDALWQFAQAQAPRLQVLVGHNALLHGDCKPTNVFVREDGHLTGLLDWEFAFSGPPLLDLGQMLRWPVPRVYERALRESYVSAGAHLPEDWRALARMLDLLNLVGFLDREEERPVVTRDCRRLIGETLVALA